MMFLPVPEYSLARANDANTAGKREKNRGGRRADHCGIAGRKESYGKFREWIISIKTTHNTSRCWGELNLNGEIVPISYDMGSGLEDLVLIQRIVGRENDTVFAETLYSGSGRFHKGWFKMILHQDFFGDGTRRLIFRLQQ